MPIFTSFPAIGDVENPKGAYDMCFPGMHTTRDRDYNFISFVLTVAEQ